jgi:GDP-4-dehydro-6-deoxy-D-mannose reductase
MKYLITGANGFVASHLSEYLLAEKQQDSEIWGTYRFRSSMENIEHIRSQLNLVECELTDFHSVYEMIDRIKPDRIYHLAAQSFVPKSWNSPVDTIMNNMMGQINIFEAVRKLTLESCRILVVGSSEEYGLALGDEVPIKETNQLRPLSPYGVSKVGQDMMGFQYNKSYNMKIVRTRAFNHEGPRRGEVFVTSNFAKQIAMIEAGLKEPVIYVGNLNAKRDFTDVRDIVRAYHDILEKGQFGEVYNICTGKQYSIREMLDILLSLSKVQIQVKTDPDRMRPSDVQNLLGDYTKIHEEIGWKPEIPFEQTLLDLLDYWRDKVRQWKSK